MPEIGRGAPRAIIASPGRPFWTQKADAADQELAPLGAWTHRRSQSRPLLVMPTTLVDWTRLYRDCGLRRTEEYPRVVPNRAGTNPESVTICLG